MPLDNQTRTAVSRRIALYNSEVNRIRSNPDLSATGKRKALAKLYAREQAAIGRLRESANGNTNARRAELEKQLFSLAHYPDRAKVIGPYRDAQDRVAAINTGAEAQQMMRRALRAGDHLLAQALFDRAWDQARDRLTGSGWGEVAKAYITEVRPDLEPAVREYEAMQNANTRTARMSEQIETSLSRPPELQGMSEYDMRQLLDGDQDVTEQAAADQRSTTNQAAAAAFNQGLREHREGVYGSTDAGYLPDNAA